MPVPPLNDWLLGTGKPYGLMIVLDSPNGEAILRKRHLSGEPLRLLEATLTAAGMGGIPVWITYSIPYKLNLKKKEKPAPEHYKVGREHLMTEIAAVKPQKILVMGGDAYSVIRGWSSRATISRVRGLGFDVECEGRHIYAVATMQSWMVTMDPDWFRDFSYDIFKLAKHGKVNPLPKLHQWVVKDADDLRKGLSALRGAKYISCDTETSGLHPWEHEMEAIGFGIIADNGTGANTVIVPYTLIHDAEVQQVLWDFMVGEDKFDGDFIFHNGKFDLKFFTTWFGKPLVGLKMHDTLLINYLLDERGINSQKSPHSLKTISRIRYDAPNYKFDFEPFWAMAKEARDWKSLYAYLSLDLYYTAILFRDIIRELDIEDPKLWGVLTKLLLPGTMCLTEIELRGVPIDVPYLESYGKQLRVDLIEAKENIQNHLSELLGVPLNSLSEFNPGSPKQVADVLKPLVNLPSQWNDQGEQKTSTGKDILEDLSFKLRNAPRSSSLMIQKADLLDEILDYRGINKLIGTYVDGIIEQVDRNGRLHGEFNLPGTGTGRLSSMNPNLQNIPQYKGLEIRKAFVAPPGYDWIKVDGSQLEYRVAAFLSQDAHMIQAYLDNRDIHIEVASTFLNIPPESVDKKQRYAAKFIGFGILYGRGPYSIATGKELRGQNWTPQKAQKFIDHLLSEFPQLKAWMANQRAMVKARHQTESYLGRKRRWPFITEHSLPEFERQALNMPIQSTASDITLNALIQLDESIRPFGAEIMLTVHDEIDVIAPKETTFEVIPHMLRVFENNLPFESNVPIKAEAEVGPSWGELRDWEEIRDERLAAVV